MNEDDLSRKLIDNVLTPAGFSCRKLFGGTVQTSGLPDWIIRGPLPRGRILLVEMKVLTQQRPKMSQIHRALRPTQRQYCCTTRGENLGVLAFTTLGIAWVPGNDLPIPLADPSEESLERWLLPAKKLIEIWA